jgi:hypothetical protein
VKWQCVIIQNSRHAKQRYLLAYWRESIAPPCNAKPPGRHAQPFNAPHRSVPSWPLPPGRRKFRYKTNPAALAPRNDPLSINRRQVVGREGRRTPRGTIVSNPVWDISESETATDGHFVAVLASDPSHGPTEHLAQPRLHVPWRRAVARRHRRQIKVGRKERRAWDTTRKMVY